MKKDKFKLLPQKSIELPQGEAKYNESVYLLQTANCCPSRSERRNKAKKNLIASKLYEELDQASTTLHYVVSASDKSSNQCFYDYTVHPYKE